MRRYGAPMMRSAARGKFHGSDKLLREDIRGPGRQNGERHLAAGQAIHDFVHRAVASAHDHELPRLRRRRGAP